MEDFFYLNPISQVGVITTSNKRAEIASELTGNPRRCKFGWTGFLHTNVFHVNVGPTTISFLFFLFFPPPRHVEFLRGLSNASCRGEPSLQNSLEVALQSLRHMPGHASREVSAVRCSAGGLRRCLSSLSFIPLPPQLLFVVGSLTTCDPGDVEATIEECKKLHVRCSVIALAAEVVTGSDSQGGVYQTPRSTCVRSCQVANCTGRLSLQVRIYRHLTKQTGGDFGVILDDVHFRDLLQVKRVFFDSPSLLFHALCLLGTFGASSFSGGGRSLPDQDGLPMSFG